MESLSSISYCIKKRGTVFLLSVLSYNCKIPRNKPNQGGKRPVLGKLYNTEEKN